MASSWHNESHTVPLTFNPLYNKVESSTVTLAPNPLYHSGASQEPFYDSALNGNAVNYSVLKSPQRTIYFHPFLSTETESGGEAQQDESDYFNRCRTESDTTNHTSLGPDEYVVPMDRSTSVGQSLYAVPLDSTTLSAQGVHGSATSVEETMFGFGEGYGEVYISTNQVRAYLAFSMMPLL